VQFKKYVSKSRFEIDKKIIWADEDCRWEIFLKEL
jgi:hypothetical protein